MALNVLVDRISNQKLSNQLIISMGMLRYQSFHERLCWDVMIEENIEKDKYDELDPYYIIAFDSCNPIVCLGCVRLLPTTGSYMLKNTFPQLLAGDIAPEDERVWEASRFTTVRKPTVGKFGFGELSTEMLKAMVRFALKHNITAIVGVTTLAIERMMRRFGFIVERLGSPQRVGSTKSLPFRLPISVKTLHAINFFTNEHFSVCSESVNP